MLQSWNFWVCQDGLLRIIQKNIHCHEFSRRGEIILYCLDCKEVNKYQESKYAQTFGIIYSFLQYFTGIQQVPCASNSFAVNRLHSVNLLTFHSFPLSNHILGLGTKGLTIKLQLPPRAPLQENISSRNEHSTTSHSKSFKILHYSTPCFQHFKLKNFLLSPSPSLSSRHFQLETEPPTHLPFSLEVEQIRFESAGPGMRICRDYCEASEGLRKTHKDSRPARAGMFAARGQWWDGEDVGSSSIGR